MIYFSKSVLKNTHLKFEWSNIHSTVTNLVTVWMCTSKLTTLNLLSHYMHIVSEKWPWSLSGKACLACPSSTHPPDRWRSCSRCMLGSLLPFRSLNWQNSRYYWCRSLPKTCGASAVCLPFVCLSSSGTIMGDFMMFLYYIFFMVD